MMTQEDGIYAFTSNVEGGDYAITSYRNNDFLNGVSTLDMVLIQKHILSLVSFDSPYKVVAADINNDESVTAVDLTELRKLILGVYTALPSNTSWRFVDSDQTLSLTNPWPLNESVNITNLSSDMMTEDFIGVKVGDVNGTAISSFNGNGTETRSNIKLDFVLEKTALGIQIKAGGNFSDIYGYQFTSRINGNITNVESGSINVGFENFGLLGNGIMTTSYASEVPISVVEGDILFELQGLTDLNLIDGFTPAEAYVNDALDVVGVSMREVNQTIEFSLGQNEPNPFIDKTTIPFSIGAEGDITLTIYELSGKVVKVIEGRYESGNHTVKLDKKDLGLTGVLYYKIECGDFIQARKMIILE